MTSRVVCSPQPRSTATAQRLRSLAMTSATAPLHSALAGCSLGRADGRSRCPGTRRRIVTACGRGANTRTRTHTLNALPPAQTSTSTHTSDEIAGTSVVTVVTTAKNAFASTSPSITLAALLSLAPARVTAIGVRVFRNGSTAVLRFASRGRSGDDKGNRDGDDGEGESSGSNLPYPSTWSLPLLLGVEILAGFLSEIISPKEIDGFKRGDARVVASIGVYVRAIRSTMGVGLPPVT